MMVAPPLYPPALLDDRRGSIQAELAFLLRLHIKRDAAPGRIVTNAGVIPEIWADRRIRMVDAAITFASAGAEPDTRDPVVLIGIASALTEAAIRETLLSCTTIASVNEVVLLRCDMIGGELWRRDPDGAWSEPEHLRPGSRLTIDCIGFDRRLTDVYETAGLKG